MSHLLGYIFCSYADLVATFGPSQCWDHFKSDAEWEVDVPGIGMAYVYNYKDGPNYLGAEGTPVEKITEWHIGGDTEDVVAPIREMVRRARPVVGSAP